MAIEQTHRFRLELDLESNDVDDLIARLHDIGYELATGKLSPHGVAAGGSGTCIHKFTEATTSARPETPVANTDQGQL